MMTQERKRRTVPRVALAASLASFSMLGACATPGNAPATHQATDTKPQDARNAPPADYASAAQAAARYGLGVLAPAMPLPVAMPDNVDSHELPPPCEPIPDEILAWTLFAPADASEAQTTQASRTQCADEAPEEGAALRYALDMQPGELSKLSGVAVQTGVAQPRRPWFSSVNPLPAMAYDDQHWTYQPPSGPAVALGNLVANAPAWGSSAPIGGLQIYEGFEHVKKGEIGYSSAFGRINQTDLTAPSGPVSYGTSAGSGALRYGLTSWMTLESQIQTAPGLVAQGVGTTWSAGDYGTFQAGATRSAFDTVNAWRYRFGYNVSVTNSVHLGVTTEAIQQGFGDLANYEAGGLDAQTRSTWSAGVPLGGRSTLSGTYSLGASTGTDSDERRLGLLHSVKLAHGAQLDWGGDRDLASGGYALRANLIMPMDTFMRGRWLSW